MSDRLRLAPEEIDRVVETLRARGGDHVSRGRGGAGFAYRDGVFYSIYVDECDQMDSPFPDEQAFRAALSAIDFEDNTDRYRQAVVRSLGANPAMTPCDPAAVARGLARQEGVSLKTPLPWRGVVREVRHEPPEAWARLTPDGHATPVWLRLSADTAAALEAQGLAYQALVGRTTVATGFLQTDSPGPGDVAIEVSARSLLSLE